MFISNSVSDGTSAWICLALHTHHFNSSIILVNIAAFLGSLAKKQTLELKTIKACAAATAHSPHKTQPWAPVPC